MKRLALIIAALALVAEPALADYKSEYKSYMTALDAGDIAKALEHGEAAWRQAETELGDHQSTAILAYNYAKLAYPSFPEKALEAFQRAAAITAQGKGALSASELALTIADLQLVLDLKSDDRADALQKLLDDADGVDPLVRAMAYRTLAWARLGMDDLLKSKSAADRAIEIASTLEPRPARLLAEALIAGAISRLAKDERSERDIAESVALLGDAFPLFPPQADIDHFDPLLARAMSWRRSIQSLVNSLNKNSAGIFLYYGGGTRIPTGEDLASAYERAVAKEGPEEWFRWATPKPEICQTAIEWGVRKPPKYPRKALRDMNLGSIVVGYHLNDAGVERAVLLADFPDAGFGDAAILSMKDWRLAKPAPDGCRLNNLTFFNFEIVFR